MKQKRRVWPRLTLGVCYYPEHWDESLWRDDLIRMKKAGIRVIRIGEFAWNKFEPEEGVFTFDFFDRFLNLCAEEGMQVIFGTPTATPPAWLTEKYPETLNAFLDGSLMHHGSRRQYNYNSPKYRELCARIVEQIAAHLGRHPAIVGWQIDNEMNCETDMFYSQADTEAFRSFLQEKYGTLDKLNETWGTVFWNQTYTSWSQITVPRPTPSNAFNPHMSLDYRRFISRSVISFCRMQSDIIRRYAAPEVYITTNGIFGHIDNHLMTETCLDVYTYDSYPNFAFDPNGPARPEALNDRMWSRSLTEMRCISPHFGVMEQQSGPNGWVCRMEGPVPRPGQMKLWTMQSVAQGADFVSYFRWRTCTFGTEMYWHGILDYDNRDNRRLQEVKEIHALLERLQPVAGADHCAEIALVRDYDNIWDAEIDVWHRKVQRHSEDAVFEVSQRTHTPYDMLFLRESTTLQELCRYPVLIYPHAVILKPANAALLKAYVEQGGTLIVCCRTGQKDERGHCVMQPMPGLLAELTGTSVKEYTFCTPAEPPVSADWHGKTLNMPMFNDVLEAQPGTEVLARYDASYYAGEAALVENHLGQGRVLHLGSVLSKENLRMILSYLGRLSPYHHLAEAPEGVEMVMRVKDGNNYLFLLNYQARPETVQVHCNAVMLANGEIAPEELVLPPFGVEVLAIEKPALS